MGTGDLRRVLGIVSMVGGLVLATSASSRGLQSAPQPAARAPTIYAITYRAGSKWKPGVPMEGQDLRDHYFYWKRLHENGRVAAAGPLGPDAGLVLLHASDQADADRVIAEDPASIGGVFVGEARRFIPRFVGATPLEAIKP